MKRRLLFVFICCFTFKFHNLNGAWEDLTDENSVFLATIRTNYGLEDNYSSEIINAVFDYVTAPEKGIEDIIQGVDILLYFGNTFLLSGATNDFHLVQKKLRTLITKITKLKRWSVKDHVIFLLQRLPDDCKNEGEYHLGRWSYVNKPGRVYLLIKELSEIHFKIPENRKTIEEICNKFLSQYNAFQNPYDDE